jgi:hypothetical protein
MPVNETISESTICVIFCPHPQEPRNAAKMDLRLPIDEMLFQGLIGFNVPVDLLSSSRLVVWPAVFVFSIVTRQLYLYGRTQLKDADGCHAC